MFYGVTTQRVGTHVEHLLRAYPLKSQRTFDQARPVPAARVGRELRGRRTHVGAGGIRTTYLTAEEAQALAP
jgi:hypothetical protein